MRKLTIAVLAIALSGCTLGTVGWNKLHNVVAKDEQSITIAWDQVFLPREDIHQMVRAHCGTDSFYRTNKRIDFWVGDGIVQYKFMCGEPPAGWVESDDWSF